MVRPDQDVIDPRGDEHAEHRGRALPRAGVVIDGAAAGVENRLVPQRPLVVDVDEGLVHGIVREHDRIDADGSGLGSLITE